MAGSEAHTQRHILRLAAYMAGSEVSRPSGRKFLREEGVARCWSVEASLLQREAADDPLAEGPHNEEVVAVDQGSTLLPARRSKTG